MRRRLTKHALPWLVFLALLALYLLLPTKNYYWDGVSFARAIESTPHLSIALLHPNHLLYNLFGFGVYKLAQAAGLPLRGIEVLQFANSVMSVGAAVLMYLILRQRSKSAYVVWSLTLLFALSATWWKFSTDADAYILGVFFLLLTLLVALSEKRRPSLCATTFSCAVLVHQLAVLAFPVFALAMLLDEESRDRRQKVRAATQFCALSLVLVLGVYYYCFYLMNHTRNFAGFLSWVTSSSPDAKFTFGILSSVGFTIQSNVRLIVSARPSLLRGMMTPLVVVLIGFLVLATCAWLFAIIRGLRRQKSEGSEKLFGSRLSKLCLIWIGVYVAFLLFWLPQNTFYRLFYLPPLILLTGELIARRRAANKPRYRLALFVVVMATANFLFFIYPYSRPEKFPPLSLALEMSSVWTPATVVYFGSENTDNNLTAYFNPTVEWRRVHDLSQLSGDVAATHREGKNTWLDASAVDLLATISGGQQWLTQHAKQGTWRQRSVRGYNVKFVEVVP